ncbi:MAG: translation elongation factor Ts [Candidatus Kapaibacteriota bacterium]|jgi:elongation factor Ts
MAEITALMVKGLRDKTGAGMADCKQALTEVDGDMELAIDYLRKKGAASAAKRADRSTNEGRVIILSKDNDQTVALTAITCETDFVALNKDFIDFTNVVAETVLNNPTGSVEELKAISVDGETIEDKYNGILSKFSEKIEISRNMKLTTDGFFTNYIHHGSKLGVILEFSSNKLTPEAKVIARDIAMQIAAMNPTFVDRSAVTQDVLDKEVEIYTQQAIEEGKNAEIAKKVALGRVEKYYKEFCLVEQVFFKDSTKVIGDVVKTISDMTGEEVKINQFIRYAIGEN